MAEFTKEQMLDELRTIFLYEADHILLGRGEEGASAFIGFALGSDFEYLNKDPKSVDLARFAISGTFEAGFDFAFRPSLLTNFTTEEAQDLVVFMEGTPRVGGVGSGGVLHRFMSPDGFCQTVADAALARWKLEIDESGSFTTRELALLANMTEGAVRNAMADKSEQGLKAIPGIKPTSVTYEEARRWLQGRRGFVPLPKRLSEDHSFAERLCAVKSASELGTLIQRAGVAIFGSREAVANQLAWDVEKLELWIDGSATFDQVAAQELAKVLELDAPLFAGKLLEVTLRRDAGSRNAS